MINTIQELEKLYYGTEGDYITKADDPVTSSTSGVFNAVFGKLIWSQLNQEANAFGLLPKVVWKNSGWRLMTAKAGSDADGGVSEGGAIPDSIKPTFVEVTNTLKTVAHSFEVTEKQQYLAKIDDDATSDLEVMRGLMGTKHKEALNQQLLADVEAQASGGSADYSGTNNFETLDRLGNVGSVSAPITLAMGCEKGIIINGQQAAMLGIGSGINSLMLGINW